VRDVQDEQLGEASHIPVKVFQPVVGEIELPEVLQGEKRRGDRVYEVIPEIQGVESRKAGRIEGRGNLGDLGSGQCQPDDFPQIVLEVLWGPLAAAGEWDLQLLLNPQQAWG